MENTPLPAVMNDRPAAATDEENMISSGCDPSEPGIVAGVMVKEVSFATCRLFLRRVRGQSS
jgi:hypothetical protein